MPIKLKDKNYYPSVFLEKYYFIEGIVYYCITFILFYWTQAFCNNSDEEYHSDKCINLLLETLKN